MYYTYKNKSGSLSHTTLSDYQRDKVYKAERLWRYRMETSKRGGKNASVFGGSSIKDVNYQFPSIQKAQDYINNLIESYWTKSWFTPEEMIHLRTLKLVFRRGNSISTAHFPSMTIELAPKWGLSFQTIIHEFAHILTHLRGNDSGHGRMFVRMHLFLVRYVFGIDAAKEMYHCYKKFRVRLFGTDLIEIEKKLAKNEKQTKVSVIHFRYNGTKKTSLHRIQKVYKVPNFNKCWYGKGRIFEWDSMEALINNKTTEIWWDIHNGKWVYFFMQDQDTWYKIAIKEEDGLSSISLDYMNRSSYRLYDLIYTPDFIEGMSEEELDIMAGEQYLKL